MATVANTETKKERKTRATLEEFFKVCLEAKNAEEAAKSLNMTVGSFEQRLRKDNKEYDCFVLVDMNKFKSPPKSRGRRKLSPDQAREAIAKLKGVSVAQLQKEIEQQKTAMEKIKTKVEDKTETKVEDEPKAKAVTAKETKKPATK
jgi:hypothetical protein